MNKSVLFTNVKFLKQETLSNAARTTFEEPDKNASVISRTATSEQYQQHPANIVNSNR